MKLEVVFRDGKKEIFDNVTGFNLTEAQITDTFEVAQTPTVGKLFRVNPLELDIRKFKDWEDNSGILERICLQENDLRRIDKALYVARNYPRELLQPFYTLVPEKKWEDDYKLPEELEMYANSLGGALATWVDQAFEWAKRICNGESKGDLFDKEDTLNVKRLIAGEKFGIYKLVGSSNDAKIKPSATTIEGNNYRHFNRLYGDVVPLVVFRKKVILTAGCDQF